jgi:hypothetical protein
VKRKEKAYSPLLPPRFKESFDVFSQNMQGYSVAVQHGPDARVAAMSGSAGGHRLARCGPAISAASSGQVSSAARLIAVRACAKVLHRIL